MAAFSDRLGRPDQDFHRSICAPLARADCPVRFSAGRHLISTPIFARFSRGLPGASLPQATAVLKCKGKPERQAISRMVDEGRQTVHSPMQDLEAGVQMLVEELILNLFDKLEDQDRTPRNFVRTINWLYAGTSIALSDAARSWIDVREQFRALPFYYPLRDRDFPANCAIVFTLALTIHLARQGRNLDRPDTSDAVSFCRYCWRLGNVAKNSRGFADRKRSGATKTHASCRYHQADAVMVSNNVKGRSVIYRKVINQRVIQKARKVAGLAEEMERLVIAKDKRDSRQQNCVPCWISGDAIITSGCDDMWPVFISHFFPYITQSEEFIAAQSSPLNAFLLFEDGNAYNGMDQLHAELSSNRSKLAFYLMPMMLRLDVSLEIERHIVNVRRTPKIPMLERTVWPARI